jgi:arginyl-tRNA synthetase
MNSADQILTNAVQQALKSLYNINTTAISFQKTRKEFEGDFTLVTFPYTKESKRSPEQIGQDLGALLLKDCAEISAFNVVKGFLNISLSEPFWMQYFSSIQSNTEFGKKAKRSSGRQVMVEYSSPNTNKPLHLGHLRNILLGYSVAQILDANGHEIIKSNLVNDRGIHICKSMLAWKLAGGTETPEKTGLKGDHLVGKYYVEFDKRYKQEISVLVAGGQSKEEAEKNAPSMLAAQEMLRQWEAGDAATVTLWKTMNDWVYKGFDVTYKNLGVDFDKIYYESDMYLLGKDVINDGLSKGVFYKKENGSVAIDLSKDGLDEKIVLRADGTSVYMTQDLGTAKKRFEDYPNLKQLIYTVGNEQDYHFKALFKILEKLGHDWAKECYHLSYGMVELPEGKMKSREGTVVDADELLQEMFETAEATTKELGKVEGFTDAELDELYRTVSLGALKYFILKVDPKKKMLFDPKESIDFNGHTGPFIQYTYARIRSVERKAEAAGINAKSALLPLKELNALEKEIIRCLYDFPVTIEEAGKNYSPAIVANYVYELTKLYNRFYHELSILKEEDTNLKHFRLQLSETCANVFKTSMQLLGIQVPERM